MQYDDTNWIYRLMRRLVSTAPMALMLSRTLHHLDRITLWLTGQRYTFGAAVSGLPVVVLESRGAKSGMPRRTTLLGIPDGENVVVIASNWGRGQLPGWCHNLRAEPAAWVTMRGRRGQVRAREVIGDERQRLWELGQRWYPGWPKYEKRAGRRRIPIFLLERLPSHSDAES